MFSVPLAQPCARAGSPPASFLRCVACARPQARRLCITRLHVARPLPALFLQSLNGVLSLCDRFLPCRRFVLCLGRNCLLIPVCFQLLRQWRMPAARCVVPLRGALQLAQVVALPSLLQHGILNPHFVFSARRSLSPLLPRFRPPTRRTLGVLDCAYLSGTVRVQQRRFKAQYCCGCRPRPRKTSARHLALMLPINVLRVELAQQRRCP